MTPQRGLVLVAAQKHAADVRRNFYNGFMHTILWIVGLFVPYIVQMVIRTIAAGAGGRTPEGLAATASAAARVRRVARPQLGAGMFKRRPAGIHDTPRPSGSSSLYPARMHPSARVVLIALAFSLSAAAGWVTAPLAPPASDMSAAATRFLDALTPEHKSKALFAFDAPQRHDWRFVPGVHHGLTFAEMTDADRHAARALVRTALSTRGMLKVEAIIELENVLRILDNNTTVRDPMKYVIAVFGTPGADAPWGWHVEGHHVSLNFTCDKGRVVSATPYFLGANPGQIRAGDRAGARALAGEEDLGRELVTSLTPSQRAQAIIAADAPDDVLSVPGRPIDGLWPQPALGVAVGDLTPEQRGVFDELLNEYLHNLRGPLAAAELDRIRGAGIDAVHFCWAGGLLPGQRHYYRIVGPTFVIEYDNTQNDANHVHTIWHDRTRDFGADALAEHVKSEGK